MKLYNQRVANGDRHRTGAYHLRASWSFPVDGLRPLDERQGRLHGQLRNLQTPMLLPREKWFHAARRAREINALNHAPVARLLRIVPSLAPTPEHLALVTTKYSGTAGVTLTVGFLEQTPSDLQARILSHMNAWSKSANVAFLLQRAPIDRCASRWRAMATGLTSGRTSCPSTRANPR